MNEKKEFKANERIESIPECKFCTSYCGDCTYFNPCKTSYGKCWCGYWKTYTRTSDDIACSHFQR